jgi:signal transduction histidine kinase
MRMAVNRSIDFTKSSSNIALQPALETVELLPSIRVAVDIMREMHSTVAIELAPLPAGLAASVITDKHWLTENVLCLLSNAVKYSDDGPISVSISLRSDAQDPGPLQAASASASASALPVDIDELLKSSSSPMFKAALEPAGGADSSTGNAKQSPAVRLRVTIADRGIGVPEHTRPHLFQVR